MPNENMTLMSIIIPVYKVEKYLHNCVDSILKQSFIDYELILVNDGSPDSCPAICDDYAADDKRIKVIHKENGGAWEARNAGIRAAIGEYLLFIDGDDFLADDSLMNVVELLKSDGKADVILLNAAYYYNDDNIKYFNTVFHKDKLYKRSHMEALTFLTSISDFNTSACLKLTKRELIISNDIFFNDIIWGEDTDFSMKLYLCAKTYNYCGSYIYYYRKERADSCTYSFSEKKFTDLLFIISKWVCAATENPDYKIFSSAIYSYFAFQYCLLLSGYNKIDSQGRKKYKAESKKYSWLLKETKDRRVLLVRIFYSILGLRLTSIALGFFEKLKQ